jgi:uncharacterized membrane protein
MKQKRVNWGVVGFLLELFALTVWVGGLVVIIAIVIPAVFNSFGMEPAGRFLRRVFDGYGVMNMGIVVLLGILVLMRHRAYGRHSSHIFSVSSAEWSLVAGMALVTLMILGVLGPQTLALQEQAFEAVSQEEKEAAYEQFFRLHMIVRALHLVNVGLAFALMVVKVRNILFHKLQGHSLPSDSEDDRTLAIVLTKEKR